MTFFQVYCPFSCHTQWKAKTVNQALTIKHTHLTNCENHDVRIADEYGILLNPEVKSEVK